jgi:hypothetical protein
MTWINDPNGPGSKLTYAQIVYGLGVALDALRAIENAWAIDQNQVLHAEAALGHQSRVPWSKREERLQAIIVGLEWLMDEYTENDGDNP